MRASTLLATLATIGAGAHFYSNVTEDGLSRALREGRPLDAVMEATALGQPGGLAAREIDLTRSAGTGTLAHLEGTQQGERIRVRLSPGVAVEYLVTVRHDTDDVIELRGHLVEDPDKHLVLGLKKTGATGFFELPNGQVHALSYAEGMQFDGPAGPDWMSDKLPAAALAARAAGRMETPPVEGAMPVLVNLPLLANMAPGQETTMQFPGIGVARVALDRLQVDADSSTWVGHLADFGEHYPVLITYSGESIEGSALTPQGEVVLTQGHAYNPQLLGLENAKRGGDNCAHGLAAHQIKATTANATPGTTASAPATASNGVAANTIDVLVYYSPDMEVLYGSANGVQTRVDALFAAANVAYDAAQLGYRLRRVGLKKIVTSETASNNDTLSRLQQGSGEFANVAAERTAAGADLVTVIRPLRTAQHVSCGVAYVGGYGGSSFSAYANYMVSMVSDGRDRNGTNTYCDTMTLAHETGHNLGLMHDRATVAQQGGGSGVKPYAFGYSFSNTWGTIMSYTSPVQYRFSDPDDTTCPGNQACGVLSTASNSADNVLALSYSLPIAAAFRTATQTAPASVTVSGIVTLGGAAVAGVTLTPSIDGVSCATSGSTGMYSCQAPSGSSFSLTPSLQLTGGTRVNWAPASASFTGLTSNTTANFAGTRASVGYTLNGTLLLDGKPVSGASLQVTGSGVTCGNTNSAGAYVCNVNSGASFSLKPNVTPRAGTTITWTPASRSYSAVKANIANASFTGKSAALPRYTLAGTVTLDGKAVAGQRVTLTGADATCSLTNSAGKYSCSVPGDASITLTPALVSNQGNAIAWTPASRSYAAIKANVATAHFSGKTAWPARTLRGSVSVTLSGALKPVAGATLRASITGVTCGATTSAGTFSCSTTQPGAFTLTPSLAKTGHVFTWRGASIPANASGSVDFIGTVRCPATGCRL